MAGGNRGHDEVDSALYIQGQKHRITDRIRRCLEWHQAIEPINGHLKIFVGQDAIDSSVSKATT